MLLDVKIDEKQMKAIEKQVSGIKNGLGKVVSRAINKSIVHARVMLKKIVLADWPVSASRFNAYAPIKKANAKTLKAYIVLREYHRPNLTWFKAKQTKKGITYLSWTKQGKQTIGKAFFLLPKNSKLGKTLVFKRFDKKLVALKAASMNQVIENLSDKVNVITSNALTSANKEIATQVEVILKQNKSA